MTGPSTTSSSYTEATTTFSNSSASSINYVLPRVTISLQAEDTPTSYGTSVTVIPSGTGTGYPTCPGINVTVLYSVMLLHANFVSTWLVPTIIWLLIYSHVRR
ncbi:hypothetical protein K504DRAFT_504578 [Pleomassaria siparia CBS 279.74]|uniref:Uncharacterized protein n=1 Tax=Pleomassaria siparia CBS 279.74 TaxID=1314801 RepID=A0A6G1K4N8_9PLEO|nr:hypothetical protein K504DRAFT_504578 [Pleomassaria siparia CBS 279.74]